MTANADEPAPANNNHRRLRVLIETTVGLLIVALAIFLYWFFVLRIEVSTDDSYVEGDLININARQMGVVKAFYADNTDLVEEGQLLVELDPTDYLLSFEEARVQLMLQARQVRELAEKVQQTQQEVVVRREQLLLDLYDYENRVPLAKTGAISQEEYETYRTKVEMSQASLLLTEHLLSQSLALLGDTPLEEHPWIQQAKDDMREAYLKVERCRIVSPAKGYVAQRNVQLGEFIQENRNMMSVIPADRMWVTANFKETQLYWLRIGQPARIKVDQYGHSHIFKGKVHGIGSGTGSVFSLLPPQNATGNWIKIVQRLPVRIVLDPGEIEKFPLRLGLSGTTTVDISDVDGKVLAQDPTRNLAVATDIYDISFKGINDAMDGIVTRNLRFPDETRVITRREP